MTEGTDVLHALRQVQSFPSGSHWFCPRESNGDGGVYLDEDIVASTGRPVQTRAESNTKRVEASQRRKDLVLDALQVFAYDGAQAETPQQWLEKELAEQLGRCDVCVREYHRARRKLKEHLMREYDEAEVAAFMQKFDSLNLKRIEHGLLEATKHLEQVDPANRSIKILGSSGIHAIFEAFNCKPFHSNEEELRLHFDHFFETLQTKRALKLGSYTPAMGWFVFQRDEKRREWATREWLRIKGDILPVDFEYVVHDAFLAAMSRVQLHCLQKAFLHQFWEGVKLIVQKMGKDVITAYLRPLEGPDIEANVCRLAYSHLQVDSDAFMPLLSTMEHIFRTSPADFWDSLGTVSHTAWLDQFFASKALKRLLQQADSNADSYKLEMLFSWMVPYLESIKPANQVTAAKALVTHLLGNYQSESYSSTVNKHCALIGLKILSTSLRSMNTLNPAEMMGPLSTEALAMTEEHIRVVAPFAKSRSADCDTATNIFFQAIFLDVRCFVAAGKSLASEDASKHRRWTPHTSLLRYGASNLDYGNMKLAKCLLSALKPLGVTEEYVTTKDRQLPQLQEAFNTTLQTFSTPVCTILEQIGEFAAEDLAYLFEDVESAFSVSSLLLIADREVRSVALDVVKGLSGHTTRRDAVSYLLRNNYSVTLRGLALALDKIEKLKPFVTASAALRFLPDVIDGLCNEQDGQLRVGKLSEADKKAMVLLWQAIWKLMRMTFTTTEQWSLKGHDKKLLMDFCRDAMEFADRTFEQFGVLKGALGGSTGTSDMDKDENMGRQLIEYPKNATNDVINWLRLRDDFLVAKSSALVCKLLTRLKEYDVQLEMSRLELVNDIISGKSRSTLTRQQKAELARALEVHAGFTVDSEESDTTKTTKYPGWKTGVIDLDKWTSKVQRDSAKTTKDAAAVVLAAASPTFEKLKLAGGLKLPSRPTPQSIAARQTPVNASDFKKKREAEMAEKKRRDARAMALLNKQKPQGSVAGEGSGARGLGLHGKEHDTAPKGSSMYVDTSSEDDDDDDGLDEELFGPKQASTSRPRLNGLTKEQANAIRQQRQGPVKKQRVVRSHRDMRARLAPDLSPLHQKLLSWEYFHDGGFPPGSGPADYAAVSNTFRDASDYQRTFQSLLVLEAWNGFLKAKEENSAKPYEIKIVSRSSVDAFVEVSSTMSHQDAKEIGEGDIVLLSKAQSPAANADAPHCLSRVSKMTRKKAHVEVTYKATPGTSLAPSLSSGTTVHGLKITSVIPLEREYGALQGLQYYDLCDEITTAKPSPLLKYGDETLQVHMNNYGVNKAQAKAIKSALDNDAFTLIQGPPGSGKTKTIVALCGALLTDSLRNAGSAITQPRAAITNGLAGGPKKMLVCAPSNAAVDELVMRFKDGIKTTSGELKKVSVVRLGRSDAINANVQDVTLDELVNRKLNITSDKTGNGSAETQKIMMEHKEVSEQLRTVRERYNEADSKGGVMKSMDDEFAALRRRKADLSQKIDTAKDAEGAQHRQADVNRRRAQQEVLDKADIICATLSGSGHDMFQTVNIEFETVVVDEAAQCVELSCLIPLKYGCAKCILVGDPQQLPPTVFSKDAARFKYEQSLFVRMQANHPQHVHLLDTQYRMHPEISAFPSKAFYESKLLDGKGMAPLRARPWHGTELLAPFRFFDVQGQHQAAPRGHSLINIAEINIALQLYRRLTADFRSYNFHGKIGIITPYKSQLRELRETFKRQFGPSIVETIEFNTTDAFQGRESEVIIFSCVRASPAGGIGFLQDIRRMNVGLTRAMSSLWVLGNSQSLMKGEFWGKLVDHAKSSDRYTTGDLQGLLSRPLEILKNVHVGGGDGSMRESPVASKSNGHAMNVHSAPSARPQASSSDAKATSKQPANRTTSTNTKTKTPHTPVPQYIPHPSTNHPSTNKSNTKVDSAIKMVDTARPVKPAAPPQPQPKRKHSSSDVEMTDAPPTKKATSALSSATASRASSHEPSAAATQAQAQRPKPPLVKKKAEASVFMTKKKPRK